MNCKYCNRIAKSDNSNTQHEIRCHSNPSKLIITRIGKPFKDKTIAKTPCAFCNLIYEGSSALKNHSLRCKLNPNRKIQVVSEDGKLKQIESNKRRNALWQDPVIGPIKRAQHSKSMKRAVNLNPEAYSSSNRGRTKQIEYNGVKFQGQWELDFYKWAEETGLNPQRATEGFKYEWNGIRTYFPDFYIESLAAYVEVKGYETDRDRAKWLQFPKKLCIIKEQEIKDIRKGIFKGLQ